MTVKENIPEANAGGSAAQVAIVYANYAAALAAAEAGELSNDQLVYVTSLGIHLVWSAGDSLFYPRPLAGATPAMTLASLVLADKVLGLSDGDPVTSNTDLAGTGTWTKAAGTITWDETAGPNGAPTFTLSSNGRFDASGAGLLGALASKSYAFGYGVHKALGSSTRTLLTWSGPAATSGAQFLLRLSGGSLNIGGFGSGGTFASTSVTGGSNGSWNGGGGQVAYADGKARGLTGELGGSYRHHHSGPPSNLSNSNATAAGNSLGVSAGCRPASATDPLNAAFAGWCVVTSDTALTALQQIELAAWMDALTKLQT